MRTQVGCLSIAALFCLMSGAFAAEPNIAREVEAAERSELDALKVGDYDAFGKLFADDARFADATGFATKAEVLQHISVIRITEYAMDQIAVAPLGRDTAVISYKMSQKGLRRGAEYASQSFASAIWAKRGGKWLCVFTQETPARVANPPPRPNRD